MRSMKSSEQAIDPAPRFSGRAMAAIMLALFSSGKNTSGISETHPMLNTPFINAQQGKIRLCKFDSSIGDASHADVSICQDLGVD